MIVFLSRLSSTFGSFLPLLNSSINLIFYFPNFVYFLLLYFILIFILVFLPLLLYSIILPLLLLSLFMILRLLHLSSLSLLHLNYSFLDLSPFFFFFIFILFFLLCVLSMTSNFQMMKFTFIWLTAWKRLLTQVSLRLLSSHYLDDKYLLFHFI